MGDEAVLRPASSEVSSSHGGRSVALPPPVVGSLVRSIAAKFVIAGDLGFRQDRARGYVGREVDGSQLTLQPGDPGHP
jgi:hypothetical protein